MAKKRLTDTLPVVPFAFVDYFTGDYDGGESEDE